MTAEHRFYKTVNKTKMLGKFKLDEDYSIPDQIQQRVNEESTYEWARRKEPPTPFPKFIKPTVEKNKVGWRIFFMAMKQLMP